MKDEIAEVQRQLAALSARVQQLEETEQAARSVGSASSGIGDHLWALTALQARLADHPSTEQGAVLMVGALTLPEGTPVSWQQSVGTAGLLETEWSEYASAFGALGHPVRIELLRHILSGIHTTAELAEMSSPGTTGQLHHHLRQLIAAGWLRQGGRGLYEVPAPRVVPLLVALMGARS